MSTIRFDLPHALVTLTVTDTGGVEIEVWPKVGQSAYVVLPPEVARHVAGAIARLADEAEAGADEPGAGAGEAGAGAGAGEAGAEADDAQGSVSTDDEAPDATPSNVYDLTSRRLARDRGES